MIIEKLSTQIEQLTTQVKKLENRKRPASNTLSEDYPTLETSIKKGKKGKKKLAKIMAKQPETEIATLSYNKSTLTKKTV